MMLNISQPKYVHPGIEELSSSNSVLADTRYKRFSKNNFLIYLYLSRPSTKCRYNTRSIFKLGTTSSNSIFLLN